MSSDKTTCKLYLNIDDKFGFMDLGDGNFDLIPMEMSVEKFVPLFKKDPSCCGMI